MLVISHCFALVKLVLSSGIGKVSKIGTSSRFGISYINPGGG